MEVEVEEEEEEESSKESWLHEFSLPELERKTAGAEIGPGRSRARGGVGCFKGGGHHTPKGGKKLRPATVNSVSVNNH